MKGIGIVRRWPRVAFDEIRRRARILVIDDSVFDYKKLFERDGYSVERWRDVKDLGDLESGAYDLILLDLQGVGTMHSADQGLGVLKHVKEKNPAQIVIAYSNADWSLKQQDFLELADAILYKAADYLEFKREVDRLLQERFSLGFYISRAEAELGSEDSPAGVERHVKRAILSGNTEKLRRYLERHIQDPERIQRVLMVVQTAATVAQLWKSPS